MQSPQAKLTQVRRILALWPPLAGDDGEGLLRAYLLAVEDYPADDVERGIDALVKGVAPGVNPSFRPKPSETGAECRRQVTLRLDSERRTAMFHPKLPPPDIDRTEDSQARVKDLMNRTVAGLRGMSEAESAATTASREAMWERTNDRFDQERGYSVGDPDGDRDAA